MLVKAQALLTKIRLRLGDMQQTKLSDFELLSALNDAQQMLWIALAESYSTIPQKSAVLALQNGRASLPEEFYSLVSIPPGACVDGMDIEYEGESVPVVYNCIPIPASDTEGSIDIPLSLMLDITEIAAAIAAGSIDGAASIATASARRVSQKREHAALPDMRPFP